MASFQDGYVAKLRDACEKQLSRQQISLAMHLALLDCHEFWDNVLKDRLTNPYVPEPQNTTLRGHYVVVRCTHDPASGEWTNVGIMVYNSEGNLVHSKMGPYDRAIQRGSLEASTFTTDMIDRFPSSYPDLSRIRQSLRSDGHAMSNTQITEPRFLTLDPENYMSLYQRMVLGVTK